MNKPPPEPEIDPFLSYATTEQLIDELGKRCRSLLVVFNSVARGKNDGDEFCIEVYRRNLLKTEAMGLARYAERTIYDSIKSTSRTEEG